MKKEILSIGLLVFVKANLADVLWKRIILNGMTGSSWRFKRFECISIAVNSNEIRLIGN